MNDSSQPRTKNQTIRCGLLRASEMRRAERMQTILRNYAIPNYLKPMQFQKIRFLGGKLGKAIAEEYDASTIGELL